MLLDTDVLLDVALDRQPHADAAAEILDRLEHGRERALHRLAQRLELLLPRRAVARWPERARFHPRPDSPSWRWRRPTRGAVRYAAELPMRDFEDALQVAAARTCGAQHIVTRKRQGLRPFADPGAHPVRGAPRVVSAAEAPDTRTRPVVRAACSVGWAGGEYPMLRAAWATGHRAPGTLPVPWRTLTVIPNISEESKVPTLRPGSCI